MSEEQREGLAASGDATAVHALNPGMGVSLGTAAAVGIGVAFIEEELLLGVAIGVGAMLAPQLMANMGRALRPAVKTAVRAGYKFVSTTRETIAEATEQLEDIVAEVKAESTPHPETPTAGEAKGESGEGVTGEGVTGEEGPRPGRRRERRGSE